jgi:MacB-like protein
MALLRRIRNLFSRVEIEREIDAELKAHIDMRTEDNIAAGMTPEQARREALIRFGNPAATKERVASMDVLLVIESIWADVRFSCRQLISNSGFATTAILVLALGMGASVAIFSFVDAALINPLPYKDPGRLVSVYEVVNTCPLCNISYMNYQEWKRSNLPFSSIEAWGWASYLVRTSEGTEPVQGARVSDGFFRTLGVTPILGRNFYVGEDKPDSPHTILITYGSWQKRFGKDPGVVGRQIVLNNISYTIIGVLPENFHFAPTAPPNSGRPSTIRLPATSGAAVTVFSALRGLKMALVCKPPPLPWRRSHSNLQDSTPIPIAIWEQLSPR